MKLNYIIIPLLVVAVSVTGSYFTSGGMEWYATISLPSWTPPGSVIGAVWTFIFILTAISIIIVWNKSERDDRFYFILTLFIVNGILNIGWSFIFFGMHWIAVAFFEAVLLGLTVLALIILIKPVNRLASLLLLPYFLWVSFASYLTYTIWQMN